MSTQEKAVRSPRVAVIGAGPSGLYAAAALLNAEPPVSVDVFDRLPTPFGLVRYGVAPDHSKMKSVTKLLEKPFTQDGLRFFGNIHVGQELRLDEMRKCYDAIVHATGSTRDRALDIPGENLFGSIGSGQFVGWYSGHIDQRQLSPKMDHPGIAVIGGGNVALDVARVLAKSSTEMATTDIPDFVLEALVDSKITDIHVIIRRGPAEVRFTPAELLQIGQLANADVILHDDGLLDSDQYADSADRRQLQNLKILRGWAHREESAGKPRRIHLRFLRTPVQVLGDTDVAGIKLERNQYSVSGDIAGTQEYETLDVGLVIRAIGYVGEPVPGLPFDARTGTIPNDKGQVLQDGVPLAGSYVTGWIKRGPSGVIGTNKICAEETVSAVLADLANLTQQPEREALDSVTDLLDNLRVRAVDWQSWSRLDAAEIARGIPRQAERVKIADLEAMLEACHGVTN